MGWPIRRPTALGWETASGWSWRSPNRRATGSPSGRRRWKRVAERRGRGWLESSLCHPPRAIRPPAPRAAPGRPSPRRQAPPIHVARKPATSYESGLFVHLRLRFVAGVKDANEVLRPCQRLPPLGDKVLGHHLLRGQLKDG